MEITVFWVVEARMNQLCLAHTSITPYVFMVWRLISTDDYIIIITDDTLSSICSSVDTSWQIYDNLMATESEAFTACFKILKDIFLERISGTLNLYQESRVQN